VNITKQEIETKLADANEKISKIGEAEFNGHEFNSLKEKYEELQAAHADA